MHWWSLQLSLVPTGGRAEFSFSLDGQPPAEEGVHVAAGPSIKWAVLADEKDRLSLTDKRHISTLEGLVEIYLGNAGSEGKITSRERDPVWGAMQYFAPDHYFARLWVSQPTLERVMLLVERGNVPKLEIWLPDPDKADGKYDEFRRRTWDVEKQPEIEIIWCKFTVEVGNDLDNPQAARSLQTPTRAMGQRLITQMNSIKIDASRIGRLQTMLFTVAVAILGVLAFHYW